MASRRASSAEEKRPLSTLRWMKASDPGLARRLSNAQRAFQETPGAQKQGRLRVGVRVRHPVVEENVAGLQEAM